jgi:hypothetical protein
MSFVERDDQVATKYNFKNHTLEINLTPFDKKFNKKQYNFGAYWLTSREMYFFWQKQDHETDFAKVNWEQTGAAIMAGYMDEHNKRSREAN